MIRGEQMRFFSSFLHWHAQRYEKRRLKKQSLGKCPDCSGSGFIFSTSAFDIIYMAAYECPYCKGSGLNSDQPEPKQ